MSDLRLDLLIGRRVLDTDGRKAGRIEEVIAEPDGKELIITEYHLGSAAFLERLSVAGKLFGNQALRTGYRVPWNVLDLSDPMKPALLCPVSKLERLPPPGGRKRRKG